MDLPVSLDKQSGVPIYVQLEQQIRLLIRSGTLTPGSAMPTVRALAVALAINYNTVARVYRDLQREGVLQLARGIGTFVSEEPAVTPLDPEAVEAIATLSRNLIEKARASGMTSEGLARLIQVMWKEDS